MTPRDRLVRLAVGLTLVVASWRRRGGGHAASRALGWRLLRTAWRATP